MQPPWPQIYTGPDNHHICYHDGAHPRLFTAAELNVTNQFHLVSGILKVFNVY